MTNTLVFHGTEIIMDLKSFMMQAKVGWGGVGVSIFMRMKNLIKNNGSVVGNGDNGIVQLKSM
jgi:hypothetical protein